LWVVSPVFTFPVIPALLLIVADIGMPLRQINRKR
jgi:hypothetical protein